MELEKHYGMNIIISADNSIKNVSDYRIERIKSTKSEEEDKKPAEKEKREDKRSDRKEEKRNSRTPKQETQAEEVVSEQDTSTVNDESENVSEENPKENNDRKGRRERGRRGRRDRGNGRERKDCTTREASEKPAPKEKQEAIILYNSRGNTTSQAEMKPAANSDTAGSDDAKEKTTWWKKLIKG